MQKSYLSVRVIYISTILSIWVELMELMSGGHLL